MADWGEGDDHVDFLCSRVSEGLDNVSAAGSADDAVINHDDVFAIDDGFDGDNLANDLFPALGCWFDEAAEASLSAIAVFHQPLLHGYPALLGIAEGCGPRGVGDGNDNIGFERIFPGENLT